ncbi:unnamed protein product [Penicillium salamii]|uniref:Tail specific protease domain-containing protein n=1 Tax=Penicillium salamii TaxID=1612424 RepID=A0A9W4JV23_9EURO|nr:unnamed protein product [Penicillium salamii]
MPLDEGRAVSFVEEYRKYLQFQSTIEILPNPPAGYLMPPTDLLGGLDEIQVKAAIGFYSNQYDFDTAISDLLKSAYDGHLSIQLCSLQVFWGKIDMPLVSISSNGTALPQVYTYSDALQLQDESSISPIVSINGQDVTEYMLSIGDSSQDWDALYNGQFKSLAQSLNFNGSTDGFEGSFTSGAGKSAYHTVGFANGSTSVVETTVTVNTFPYENGTSLWESYCLPQESSDETSEDSSNSTSSLNLEAPDGYPEPVIREKANRILGFLPDSKGLEDTAVLVVPTFVDAVGDVTITNGTAEFARIARDFISNATSAGRTRMIIDLSGNGGGVITSGLNLFRLFFPNTDIYTAARWRAHESVDLAGQAADLLLGPSDSSWLNWKSQVKPDQKTDFESWKDLFGPHDILGIPSSSLIAYDNFSMSSTSESPISGYGDIDLDPAEPAFKAEDIILASVRTIAFGGRPSHGPMQGMGGVKGSQVYRLKDISDIVEIATPVIQENSNSSDPIVAPEDMDHFNDIFPIPLSDFPLTLTTGFVNLLNAFKPTNHSLPRQFIYEAAECRRYFTLDNIIAPETLWASAADAMFYGGDCVPGSTNGTGSLWPSESSTPEELSGFHSRI